MLIYNKKISVSPITTHLPIKHVTKNINKLKIIKNTKSIDNFYKNILKKNQILLFLDLILTVKQQKKLERKKRNNTSNKKVKK